MCGRERRAASADKVRVAESGNDLHSISRLSAFRIFRLPASHGDSDEVVFCCSDWCMAYN